VSLEIVERRCQAPQRTLPGYPIPDSSIHIPLWLIYALVALVFWGVTGVTQKLSTNAVSSQLSFLWFAVSIIVISEGVAVAVPIRRHMAPRIFWMPVIDGALNGLGALTSFAAFEKGGKASIVVPLCYLFPLVTVVLALTFCTSRSPGRRRSASSLHCSSASPLQIRGRYAEEPVKRISKRCAVHHAVGASRGLLNPAQRCRGVPSWCSSKPSGLVAKCPGVHCH